MCIRDRNGRVSYLAIVNPAAGGGRSRKMLGSALERLRAGGVTVDVAETQGPGAVSYTHLDVYKRQVADEAVDALESRHRSGPEPLFDRARPHDLNSVILSRKRVLAIVARRGWPARKAFTNPLACS